MSKNEIVGPYFFQLENVTGSKCKRMHGDFFPDFETTRKARYPNIVVHYTLLKRSKTMFGYEAPNSMDGQGWTDFQSFTLSNLTPRDYFLWRKLRDIVYHDISRTADELRTKTGQAIQTMSYYMYLCVHKKMKMRLYFAVRERGGPFESLIYYYKIQWEKFQCMCNTPRETSTKGRDRWVQKRQFLNSM